MLPLPNKITFILFTPSQYYGRDYECQLQPHPTYRMLRRGIIVNDILHCDVTTVQCGATTVQCGATTVQCDVTTVQCGATTVQCGSYQHEIHPLSQTALIHCLLSCWLYIS